MNNIPTTVVVTNTDITSVTSGVVVHGCNCQGKMNSGVAKSIRNVWPMAFRKYLSYVTAARIGHTHELLGDVCAVRVDPNIVVVNGFTQNFYGRDGKRYADMVALSSVLTFSVELAIGLKQDLHMPLIGTGLGGLKLDEFWETLGNVVDIYQAQLMHNNINIIVHDYSPSLT